MSQQRPFPTILAAGVFAVALLFAAWVLVWQAEGDALVVYCAHDAVYAEAIIKQFEADTGIPVAVRYDTEATKSLGLIELLIREAEAPRCDVFWNNELLGMLDLRERGLLEACRSTGWQRMPDSCKDPEGLWTGFGARLRVVIVNTDAVAATPEAIAARLAAPDLERVCQAKPLYGTTLTHYAVMSRHLGGLEALKAWHAERRERGLRILASNGQTKEAVAGGVCDLGYTDTDDFFLAKDAGKPVAALPVRLPDGRTIAIPNTVGIIKGTQRRAQAETFVNYLLSAKTELALARSTSRQIPLGPVPETQIPADVQDLALWARDSVDLNGLLEHRRSCVAWLKEVYTE